MQTHTPIIKAMKEHGVLKSNKKVLPVAVKQQLMKAGYSKYVKKHFTPEERKKVTDILLNAEAKKLYLFSRDAHF